MTIPNCLIAESSRHEVNAAGDNRREKARFPDGKIVRNGWGWRGDIQGNVRHAPFRFAEQASGFVHQQGQQMSRRRHAHGILKQASELESEL
jgi:hypothetical protein